MASEVQEAESLELRDLKESIRRLLLDWRLEISNLRAAGKHTEADELAHRTNEVESRLR